MNNDSCLRSHFPDEVRILVQKRKTYLSRQREVWILQTCEAIRKITFDLHNEGRYPSKKEISIRIGRKSEGMMRTREFEQAWHDALRELGLEDDRNSSIVVAEYRVREAGKTPEGEMECPHCHGRQVVKNGTIHNGKPKWKCKVCGRQFSRDSL